MKKIYLFLIIFIGFILFMFMLLHNKNNIQKVFYYDKENNLITEKTENLMFLNFLYFNKFGVYLKPIFIQKFMSKLMGFYQDSYLSKYQIKSFIKKHDINMFEFSKSENEYKNFNDFFIRELKPNIRTIDNDINTIIAPADSKLFVIPDISQDTEFFVKNIKFNLNIFLNNNELAKKYDNGLILIFRLSPSDYHRFHTPFDCIILEAKNINGNLESVNSLVYKSGLQPLYTNERKLITLNSELFGSVLFIPVGAMFVGKIVNTYKSNRAYKKGEEIGYFKFGGSTIVLVFEKNKIKVKDKFLTNSKNGYETQVKIGDVITG